MDDTYFITITVYDKSGNFVSVSYAVTIENDFVTVTSSTTTSTITSETSTSDTASSSSSSDNGADLPIPFDFISSLVGLISLVSLMFVILPYYNVYSGLFSRNVT